MASLGPGLPIHETETVTAPPSRGGVTNEEPDSGPTSKSVLGHQSCPHSLVSECSRPRGPAGLNCRLTGLSTPEPLVLATRWGLLPVWEAVGPPLSVYLFPLHPSAPLLPPFPLLHQDAFPVARQSARPSVPLLALPPSSCFIGSFFVSGLATLSRCSGHGQSGPALHPGLRFLPCATSKPPVESEYVTVNCFSLPPLLPP